MMRFAIRLVDHEMSGRMCTPINDTNRQTEADELHMIVATDGQINTIFCGKTALGKPLLHYVV